jgi:toxin ParE1/3/4
VLTVARFRFSRRAEADLLSIGDYTLRSWGKAQAAHYIGELQVCCQTLADNPALGRLCDDVRPGLHVWSMASTSCFTARSEEAF